MMRSSDAFITLVLIWLAAIAHTVDLSYNGLAITPQMGWVRTIQVTCHSSLRSPQLTRSASGQLERLCL
jgi:hypothetical protein